MSAYETLKIRLAAKAEVVRNAMAALADGRAELIPLIGRHLLSSGGKRIRPLLTLACADMFGYEGSADVSLAAAVEFIHTATLLHDDVVDGSDVRRGKDAAHVVWGNKETILVGDFLLSRAFSLMGEANSLAVYRILSDASVVITEGEVMQLEAQKAGKLEEEDYLRIVRAKTAALFAAACSSAGALCDRSAPDIAALDAYGDALGVAFQIADDMIDYLPPSSGTGKTPGDDFRERKITLPLIYLLKRADESLAKRLSARFSEGEEEAIGFDETVDAMCRFNILDDVEKTLRRHSENAADALLNLPKNPTRDALALLAVELAGRCR
ncbi:MAG: polyprenyl synthetase family protein [Rickettsiales bacterium]